MSRDAVNRIKPCFQCKTLMAKIGRNKNAVGVICDCGIVFVFENAKMSLKEVVE